jgi:hypothetical protein
MKLRSDFVTNSSSSSFIIGKKGDKNTKDTVFLKIVKFYNEMFEQVEKLKKDMGKWYLVWDEERKGFKFDENQEDKWYSKEFELNETLEKEYGISTWDYFPEKGEWLECKTYDEYVAYWSRKRQEKAAENKQKGIEENGYPNVVYAPFYIVDYETDNVINIGIVNDCNNEDETETIANNWDSESLIGWYYGCADELLGTSSYPETPYEERDCKYCDRRKGSKRCLSFRENVKNGTITKDNAVLFQLGKICVHSECGHISEYVVNKLAKISEYHCNHMG